MFFVAWAFVEVKIPVERQRFAFRTSTKACKSWIPYKLVQKWGKLKSERNDSNSLLDTVVTLTI
jgi:hypothetical protein